MHPFTQLRQRLRPLVIHGLALVMESSSHLGDRLRLGIASRLIIAFVGVGALVLAANVAVEGVLVERTTEITRTLPAPIVPTPAPTRISAPVVKAEPELKPVERRSVSSEALLLALERFGEAVQDRSRTETDGVDARFRQAAREAKRAGAAFTKTAASISGKSFARVDEALQSYFAIGDTRVDYGDRCRAFIKTYDSTFEGLNARDKASLAGSWKVFGRVLAKQSLLQLSTDLDSLRHAASRAFSVEVPDEAVMAAWAAAEAAVGKDVNDNQANLRRSEGAAWYEAVHQELMALAALRQSVADTEQQIQRSSQECAQLAQFLQKLIPVKVESAAVAIVPRKFTTATVAMKAPVLTSEVPIVPALSVPRSPTVQTHVSSRDSQQAHRRRLEIAWISAGAVLLLVYIATGTVLSIVRPVRRLVRASAQLSRGDTTARVERGGINELDTVAIAFNTMAEELQLARLSTENYQHSLEMKVVERTRQLQEFAERDPLTDLPNRRHLFHLLNQTIEKARQNGSQVGVFFMDIDNFKNINDGMGHAFGDRVLIAMAGRLRETVESFGFAARLGGDEFTVVYSDCPSTEAIRTAGINIVQAFQKPLSVDGRELIVSVSIGASLYPDHELEPQALLKAADAALFRAKALGRSQLSVFTPDLLEAAAAKFLTEQALRHAITRGEFELVFQPEVCAETLQTALVEALIRWRMPDGALASPAQFLAIAEESGLIMDISDWVLTSAVEAAAHWHHGAWPEACVAINVVPRQLADPGFVERLVALLRVHRLPSRCIEIELTESVLQTGTSTIDALQRLRAHGFAIALDDFGTGYSSLASLELLPLSRIKLDRSLIEGIDSSPRSQAIARAIIAMCRDLGLEVTAEGIERAGQFCMLKGERRMYLQGYLLARPVSRDEIIPLLPLVAQRAQSLLLESDRTPIVVAPAPAIESVKRSANRPLMVISSGR